MTNKLTRWSPFLEPFEDMERAFSDFLPTLRGERGTYMPAIDMYEDNNNVIVEAQLAGMDPENVELTIENDILTIKGESEKENEVEDKNYYRKEIKRGSFYRNIPMPATVEGDNAKAEAQEGVLKVTVPKAKEAKSTPIKIEKKGKEEEEK